MAALEQTSLELLPTIDELTLYNIRKEGIQ